LGGGSGATVTSRTSCPAGENRQGSVQPPEANVVQGTESPVGDRGAKPPNDFLALGEGFYRKNT